MRTHAYHRCFRRSPLVPGLLLLAWLLTSCADTSVGATTRATAMADGCWPYGHYQPVPPTTPAANSTAIALGTPTATHAPTVSVYPTCLPAVGTPTVTPSPIPPRTPQPRDMHVGLAEIGATNGKNTNHAVAIDPLRGTAIVGWVNWGADPTKSEDGMIWVRAQLPNGQWGTAQTLNTTDASVNGLVGGLALAAPAERQVMAVWGDGKSAVWSAESLDSGATWSLPTQVGSWAYQIIDLKADLRGGVHLLALTSGSHHLVYSYRASANASWSTPTDVGTGRQYQAAFAVLDLPGGGVRRFAAYTTDSAPKLRLLRSDDGTTWTDVPVDIGRYMEEIAPIAPALVAALRPDGTGAVTLAWCQYSKSGVFAQVSTDSGSTWGQEEPIFRSVIDGYWPSLAYDHASDTVVIVVTELKRHHIPPHRVRLAARPLAPGSTWRFSALSDLPETDDDGDSDADPDATTPEPAETTTPASSTDTPISTDTPSDSPSSSDGAPAPKLAQWGWRGRVFGDVAGSRAWLVSQDERNGQDRVYAQPLYLPALLAQEVS